MNWGGFLKSFTRYFLSFSVLAFVASFLESLFSNPSGSTVPISAVSAILDYVYQVLGISQQSLEAMDLVSITQAVNITSAFFAIIFSLSVLAAWGGFARSKRK